MKQKTQKTNLGIVAQVQHANNKQRKQTFHFELIITAIFARKKRAGQQVIMTYSMR